MLLILIKVGSILQSIRQSTIRKERGASVSLRIPRRFRPGGVPVGVRFSIFCTDKRAPSFTRRMNSRLQKHKSACADSMPRQRLAAGVVIVSDCRGLVKTWTARIEEFA